MTSRSWGQGQFFEHVNPLLHTTETQKPRAQIQAGLFQSRCCSHSPAQPAGEQWSCPHRGPARAVVTQSRECGVITHPLLVRSSERNLSWTYVPDMSQTKAALSLGWHAEGEESFLCIRRRL